MRLGSVLFFYLDLSVGQAEVGVVAATGWRRAGEFAYHNLAGMSEITKKGNTLVFSTC